MSKEYRPFFLDPSQFSDKASVSASSAAGEAVATNVQNKLLKLPWRSVGLGTQYFTFDYGVSRTLDSLAIIAHNFTYGATVEIWASNDPTFTVKTIVHAEGTMLPVPFGFGTGGFGMNGFGGSLDPVDVTLYALIPLIRWSETTARYWRIFFRDATNPAGYMQVGRLMLDHSFLPESGYSYGYETGIVNPISRGRTRGLGFYSGHSDFFVSGTFTFDRITVDEYRYVVDKMWRRVNTEAHLLFCLDESAEAEPWHFLWRMVARFSRMPLFKHANAVHGQMQIQLEEEK